MRLDLRGWLDAQGPALGAARVQARVVGPLGAGAVDHSIPGRAELAASLVIQRLLPSAAATRPSSGDGKGSLRAIVATGGALTAVAVAFEVAGLVALAASRRRSVTASPV